MTKKLEELLDLPEVKETMEQVQEPKQVQQQPAFNSFQDVVGFGGSGNFASV